MDTEKVAFVSILALIFSVVAIIFGSIAISRTAPRRPSADRQS